MREALGRLGGKYTEREKAISGHWPNLDVKGNNWDVKGLKS